MVRGYRAREILEALRGLPAGAAPGLEVHAAFLEAQMEVEATVALPRLTPDEARSSVEAGAFLLAGSRFAASIPGLARRRLADRLRRLAATCRPDLLEALDAAGRGLPSPLAAFLLAHTLRAFYRPAAAHLAPLVDEARWMRGDCPICGGHPDFAALAGEAGARRLLCSCCDAEWAYARIGCPFCGSARPDEVGYHLAGDGTYRLYTCRGCRGYLKAVNLGRRGRTCLPVERVLTAGLDCAAIDAGYGSPGGQAP